MDPDQTAPLGAVRSGSTVFASMLMLNRYFQMQLFCWRFKDLGILLLLNKTTPYFQLLLMSKVDQSTVFASMLMLNRHFQMQLFCWRFKD